MPEDVESPDEKPRYLLPDGCKDLIEALRLEEHETDAAPEESEPLPTTVAVPDPVAVADLAERLHLKRYVVLKTLMDSGIFATLQTELDFGLASRVCSLHGVIAHKII